MPKSKEMIIEMYAKWYQKNKKSDFAKTLNEMEKAISKEMINEVIDYLALAESFNVAVVEIVGARRNMVERWKKTVQKRDGTKYQIDSNKLRIKLKKLRIFNGLSHQELSKKTGISRSSIYSWEQSWTNPNIDHLLTLSEFYEVSLNELLLECLVAN